MKYKVSIQIVEPEANYNVRTVYEQVKDVDETDGLLIENVIKAVNGIA
jgi:hypothetical protein